MRCNRGETVAQIYTRPVNRSMTRVGREFESSLHSLIIRGASGVVERAQPRGEELWIGLQGPVETGERA